MTLIDVLCRLQDADREWDEHAKRFRQIKENLSEDSLLNRAQAAQQELDSALVRAQQELKRTEQDIEALRQKATETQEALYSGRVRNPREVEGLRRGSEQLKEQISYLEDRALELMTELDDLEAATADGSKALGELTEERSAERRELASQYESLRSRLQALKRIRTELRQQAGAVELALYDQLRAQKGGVALAPIRDGRCGMCNVSVPSNKVTVARHGTTVVTCDGCGRVLYAP